MNAQPSASTDRIDVLGIQAHALNIAGAKSAFLAALKHHTKGYVCFASVHGIMEAQDDPILEEIYRNALLVAPDGMPLVWVGHLQGLRSVERVAGPEIMLEVMRSPDFRHCSHFLLGGEPGMAEELRARLEARCPGVNICGTFTRPSAP